MEVSEYLKALVVFIKFEIKPEYKKDGSSDSASEFSSEGDQTESPGRHSSYLD
jgi:hypothetical protein